jgi:hypothetical protein
LIKQAKQNSQQGMNSKDDNDGPEIIDLDPASVTDHDKASSDNSAGKQNPWTAPTWLRPSARSPAVIAVTALAVGVVAGGWIYRDYLWRYLPNAEVSAIAARTEALTNDTATLKEKIASIEMLAAQLKDDIDADEANAAAAASAAKSASQSVASLDARVNEVNALAQDTSDKLNTLADGVQKLAGSADGIQASSLPSDVLQRLESLEKDVASLKAQKNEGATDTALLSQSLADLKAKVAAGAPYGDELERLNRLVPAAPGLAELAPFAGAGLHDAKGLAQELASLAAALPKEGELQAVTPKDDSWTGWVLDQLSDLITIRVAGTADWKRAAEQSVAFAESGDLQQAIDTLEEMEGAKPQGIEQWLEKAKARLSIEAQLKSVEEAVLRAIAAKG